MSTIYFALGGLQEIAKIRSQEVLCPLCEFLGDTLNIWDNDRAMVYCI
jgi:hypothetical protein